MEPVSHIKATPPTDISHSFTFIDLFAGIGGCRLGWERAGGRCVFTSEWDKFARLTYEANFPDDVDSDHVFAGDITKVPMAAIPEHDVLVAGFPCQPFSIAGVSKKNALGRPHGFLDMTQGTLFFDVAKIIKERRPRAFMLENVRNLESHDKGKTFAVIRRTIEELDYEFHFKVLDASAVVPQGRRRIFMVGFDKRIFPNGSGFSFGNFELPRLMPTMADVMHRTDGTEPREERYTDGYGLPLARYTLTEHLWTYLQGYKKKHQAAGNGFGYGLVGPNDIARTLSARYYKDGSEILVDQGAGHRPRRPTPRECARLMGFPDGQALGQPRFEIPVSDTQAYKQFGNSVVVPVVSAVAKCVAEVLTAQEQGVAVAG